MKSNLLLWATLVATGALLSTVAQADDPQPASTDKPKSDVTAALDRVTEKLAPAYSLAYKFAAGDEIRTPERGPYYAIQLVELVEQQLKLNPVRIAPVHGRLVPYQNLKIAFGIGAAGTN